MLQVIGGGEAVNRSSAYLGFPRSAAWCRALKPLLLVRVMSAPWSNNRANMSSRFFVTASWSAVSPSESCDKDTKSPLSFPEKVVFYFHTLFPPSSLGPLTLFHLGASFAQTWRCTAYPCPPLFWIQTDTVRLISDSWFGKIFNYRFKAMSSSFKKSIAKFALIFSFPIFLF